MRLFCLSHARSVDPPSDPDAPLRARCSVIASAPRENCTRAFNVRATSESSANASTLKASSQGIASAHWLFMDDSLNVNDGNNLIAEEVMGTGPKAKAGGRFSPTLVGVFD